jgi:5-formyltetrahydrofolate cyclo-ligase
MNKNTLRHKIKAIRNRLPISTINKLSGLITSHFTSTLYPLLPAIGIVIIYMSSQSEVKTKAIIDYLHSQKRRLYVPCVVNSCIEPSLVTKICGFVRGPFNIPEPSKKKKLASLKNVSVVIVPGIAFDRKGNRLGFGGGYFDKFLSMLPKRAVKVGLAFSNQILRSIPHERHDVKMDYLVTEKGVFQM